MMNIGTSVGGSWCSSVGGIIMDNMSLFRQEEEQALVKEMYETYGLRLVHDGLTPEEKVMEVLLW